MRYTPRFVAFILSLLLGISIWGALAYRSRTAGLRARAKRAPAHEVEKAAPLQTHVAPLPSVKFEPVGPLAGYAITKKVTLRQSAQANAPVIATLKALEYEHVEVLGATRDFIHVRFRANEGMYEGLSRTRDYEGWVTWGEVAPHLSAIILDAGTGEVISRVPLDIGRTSIAYSPDGSRAVFYHPGRGSTIAQEVSTSDYTLTRNLVSSSPHVFGSLFYGPTDGALYASVFKSTSASYMEDVEFSVLRIGDNCAPNTSIAMSGTATDFVVSPDGRTGFILHTKEIENLEHAVTIDVVDLETLSVRNTFALEGRYRPWWARMLTMNKDGSELYSKLTLDADPIKVIDTRTGQTLRELPASSSAYTGLDQQSIVGDSLLLHKLNETPSPTSQPLVWLNDAGAISAQRGIYYAVEAGDSRFAINDEGTRLFKLDPENRILDRLPIERPDRRHPQNKSHWPQIITRGLAASPDGKRLIMFVEIELGC